MRLILLICCLLMAGCTPQAYNAFSAGAYGASYGMRNVHTPQGTSGWYNDRVNESLNSRSRPVHCYTYGNQTTCY